MYSKPEKNSLISVRAVTGQRKPARAAAGFRDNRPLAAAQRKMCGVIQRATSIPTAPVPTNYGIFNATRYEINDKGTGVNMRLEFQPDDKKVNATKIGMVQSCCTKDGKGELYENDPRIKERMVRGGTGGGYKIDRLGNYRNPVYGVTDNSKFMLSNTPDIAPGMFTTYGLGWSYKVFNGPYNTRSAYMEDHPDNHARIEFETTALALCGPDAHAEKYYGSVKWGFAKILGKLIPIPLAEVSRGAPSPNFVEAAKEWNKQSDGKPRKSGQTFKTNKAIKVDRVRLLEGKQYPFQWSVNRKLKKLCLKVGGVNRRVYIDKTQIDTDNKMKKNVSCKLSFSVKVPLGESVEYKFSAQKENVIGFFATLPKFDTVEAFIQSSDVDINDGGIDNIPLPIP